MDISFQANIQCLIIIQKPQWTPEPRVDVDKGVDITPDDAPTDIVAQTVPIGAVLSEMNSQGRDSEATESFEHRSLATQRFPPDH